MFLNWASSKCVLWCRFSFIWNIEKKKKLTLHAKVNWIIWNHIIWRLFESWNLHRTSATPQNILKFLLPQKHIILPFGPLEVLQDEIFQNISAVWLRAPWPFDLKRCLMQQCKASLMWQLTEWNVSSREERHHYIHTQTHGLRKVNFNIWNRLSRSAIVCLIHGI